MLNRFKKILFFASIGVFCNLLLLPHYALGEENKIVIGVFADRGEQEARLRWQKTIDWLNQQIDTYHFTLQPLPLEKLQQEISSQQIQFIIVNPSESIRLGRVHSLSWLATLISPMDGGSTYSTGSALWVKSNSNVVSVDELTGRTIGTAHQQAFGGFMAFAHELHKKHNIKVFFSNLVELGYPHESVVQALLDGKVDAAILPVCLVESMISKGELTTEQLRIVNRKNHPNAICLASTRLYPNWSFAMTNSADRQLAKQILHVLLKLPSDSTAAISAQSLGWSVPESKVELDVLFSELGQHPLQKKWWEQVYQWLLDNYLAVGFGIFLLAILPVQHFILTLSYQRNLRQLGYAQQNLQLLQRRALVEKLGSSLAHELNQPLAAIRLYVEGEIARRKQGRVDTDIMLLLTKMQHQVIRIDEVVTRFRSLLQKKIIAKQQVELSTIITQTVGLVQIYASQKDIDIKWKSIHHSEHIWADKAAIEQLLVNLLTNAIDASHDNGKKQVMIEITTQQDSTQITIQDEGTGLPQPFESLITPFVTTKPDGIGLGLTICKEVVESHSGELVITNLVSGGSMATVRFPKHY